MTNANSSDYRESRVKTATPAQLHLMLVEGALRFVQQADKALLREDTNAANASLVRALEIVEELLVGVRHSTDVINTKLAQLYHFVFLEIGKVYASGNREQLADAIHMLEFQRDTWRQACKKIQSEGARIDAPAPTAPAAHLGAPPVESGLSLEA